MTSNRLANRDFRVGGWLVQPLLARIQRGDKTVRVTPRAMAVLVYLAEANGAVVSRNDLLDAIWPNMAVTPDALSQCLVELRRAFGDDSKSPRTIETIRKIGVRLIPAITVEESAVRQPATTSVDSEIPTRQTIRKHVPQPRWVAFGAIVIAGVALAAVFALLAGGTF